MALIQCSCFSQTLKYETGINIILPDPLSREEKYSVLYLLHGLSDDHTKWLRYTSIERYATQHRIAVVMPSVLRGYYTDMHRGYKYFTYVSEELPRLIKSMFPITDNPNETYVAGLSMGGYGAFKLALTYPDRYAFAGSFSGSVDMVYSLNELLVAEDSQKDDELIYEFSNIFSSIDILKGSNNDVMYLAEQTAMQKKVPKLYMWCGTEDFLYQSNLNFKRHAENLKLPLTYEEGPGDHTWKYWDECIQSFFDFIKKNK